MEKPKTVKNRIKESKAITLIALIITIIVLLILAGVTIAAISGNENAMGKANEAKIETDIASAKEAAMLKATEFIQDYYQGKYVDNDSGLTTYTTVGAYVAKQFETQTQSGNYYIKTDANTRDLKVSLDASQSNVIVEGTIEDNGTITWGDGVAQSGGGSTPVTPTEPQAQTLGAAKDILTLKIDPNDSTKFISPYVNYTMGNGTTVLCQVLYNDGTNVEIIPVNPVDTVQLGYSDSNVTSTQVTAEKNTLPTFSSIKKYENSSWVTGTVDEYATAKVSYNNAVTTLNSIATNTYKNTELSDTARCVGSNPSSPADNSGYYTNTSNYTYQTTYKVIGGDYYKAEDNNYEDDFEQLGKIGALQITDSNAVANTYWLASRRVDSYSDSSDFSVRYVYSSGGLSFYRLCNVHSWR